MNKEQERFLPFHTIQWIFAALFPFLLSGCFLFPEEFSTSLPLTPLSGQKSHSPWKLRPLNGSSPYAYQKLRTSDGSSEPIFLTAIKDCSPTAPLDLMPSTTRQLLIGFNDIFIEQSQHLKSSSGPLLRSLVKATLEGESMLIAHYALVRDDCLVDFVVWTPETPSPHSDSPSPYSAELLAFAEQIPLLMDDLTLEEDDAQS